ncbi:MAG TPA: ligase-associated DNA damage response DEXH box helicase [Alphaproteobacteria bacterium]
MVQKSHAQSYSSDPTPVPQGLVGSPLDSWIKSRGWHWFPHQLEALKATQDGHDVIVFAPTGAGKTLSGFLPSMVDLMTHGSSGKLHTLYISPLKALAVDVHRNIGKPIEEMRLPISFETRTGDTPQSKRQRQKNRPPDMLMTTPESLALLLSYEEAPKYFANLKYVIIDEMHALMHTKRGDLLSLGLARLATLVPKAVRIGLSATLDDRNGAKAWLCRQGGHMVDAGPGPKPDIEILETDASIPWAGHMAAHAARAVYEKIKTARMSVVFVNTRAQAEFVFQNLWKINDDNLRIAIHHGSLQRELRREVENRMAAGALDCVVATSSLDLGLDWAEVDLVVQIGAPKGVSRLLQRVGRSNHRLNEPSRAALVPTNRFEYLECIAAKREIARGALDSGTLPRDGGLDVLAQHIFGRACSGPFVAREFYKEVTSVWPYRNLSQKDFADVISFVKDGGYALKAYENFARLVLVGPDTYALRDPKDVRRYRMNIGTIVEAPMMKVKLKNRTLGTIEEQFIQNLTIGDTFMFGGEVLTYEGVYDNIVRVSRSKSKEAKIPSYMGGKLSMSTHLSYAVRYLIGHTSEWVAMPDQIQEWLGLHKERSRLPDEKTLLIETFPFHKRHYLVAYTFAGRNANQTLGFLVMRRMNRLNCRPIGFTMTDYALGLWSLKPLNEEDIKSLFSPDILFGEFQEWLQDTPLLKRLFRDAAVIAGLVERRHPGQTKTGKQMVVSSDLIFNVLQKYEPEHILLRAAEQDARAGLVDSDRLSDLLLSMQDHLKVEILDQISPMAVPMLLQITRESLSKKVSNEFTLADLEQDILEAANVTDID